MGVTVSAGDMLRVALNIVEQPVPFWSFTVTT